ncbi:hypothetical protein [Salicola sp. Rm-C-2C1-2]|uniref:hypothetical protein n=1 Tax=Salicola sp. Rm-C-2C1-2 TaxID=3141321 RepID=UPI0032E4B83C
MTRHTLRTGIAFVAVTALAGCLGNSDSDEYGEDITRYEGRPDAGMPGTYNARVINGKLGSVFVWLDMDGDQQLSSYDYDEYSSDFLTERSREAEPPSGVADAFPVKEPWALTDAEGNVSIDVSGFDLPETLGPDIDPKQFSLMAIAIPEVTTINGAAIDTDRAFFLSAPPGITTVSPFSTLAETLRWLNGGDMSASQAASRLLQDDVFGGRERVSPYQDYLKLQDVSRLPHYATALRRLIQAQIPDSKSQALPNPEDAASSRPRSFFQKQDLRVIGSLALDQAGTVIQEIDAGIGGGDPERYTLPPDNQLESIRDYGPDLSNPNIAVEQRYYIPAENLDSPADFDPGAPGENGRLSAQLFLEYGLGGRFRRVNVRGQTRPSMSVFHFLAGGSGSNAGNPVALGHTPYLDIDTATVVKETLSRDAVSPSDLDERFTGEEAAIDWQTPRIGLDSARIGNQGAGAQLDGTLEREYVAPADEAGNDYDLIRRPPGTSGPGSEGAAISIDNGPGYTQAPLNFPLWSGLSDSGPVTVDYGALEDVSGCSGDTIQHINKQQPVTITNTDSGDSIDVTRYGHFRANPDDDELAFRVMAETYPISDHSGLIVREYEHVTESAENPDEVEEPDRLASVRVLAVDDVSNPGSRFCGGGDEEPFSVTSSPSEMRLYIGYEYRRFAEYLESIGTQGQ